MSHQPKGNDTLKLVGLSAFYLTAVFVGAVLLPFAYAGYQMTRAWRSIARLVRRKKLKG